MPSNKKHAPFTVDDLWQLDRIGSVSVAPDGSRAVCSVTRYSMDENKGSSGLWLLSTDSARPRRLTSGGEKDGHPAWSPAGDAIAFIAKREQEGKKDDAPQLYVISPDGGEARRVSDYAPGIESFKWFPDGRRIAFAAWVWPDAKGAKAQAKRVKAHKERKETAYVTSAAQYRYWDHQLPMGRVVHLHVLDVATGRVTDLFEGSAFELTPADPNADAYDVSPDGRHIAFAYDPEPVKRLDNCKALAEVAVKSGRIEPAARDAAWDFDTPRYSPDGGRIAFVAGNLGRKHTMPGHAALLTRGDGRWEVVSDAWDHAVGAPLLWGEDGATLWFAAEDRGRRHVWRYDLATRRASIAAQGGWVHAYDRAGGVLVSVADAMQHPAQVHARRDSAAPLRLESFNDALLARFSFGRHESVEFTGAQDEAVQMWLIYPPGFDPKRRYPILHSIHGGPHAAAADTFHYRWNTQVFAAQGYVVACVNYHGSSGFGQTFLDSITHRWGTLELEDVEAATDWLLARPWADATRVYATGGSYGGYMVAWMNGHVAPGRYNAYVCHAGCYDWTAMISDDAYGWHVKELGAAYWDDPAKVQSQSPNTFAKAMRTPTLVIHGALDYRVPDQQGLAYYNTLQSLGVDTRLVWFPDENHWILKPRNSRLWYGEFFDWLRCHDPVRKKAKGRSAGKKS
ncbi:MAG: S9 family peptidase [Proteobacteria bacterium]|nr:S9 family peptidase [Pseudomonadota bacterium]